MDFPDRNTLFAVGRRSIITTPNLRINPKVVDIIGSDVNLIVGLAALVGEELSAAFVSCSLALFVATAVNEQLDQVAFDRFQLTRLPANPASVPVTLARPTSGAGGGTVPQGTRFQTAGGTQFALDIDVVFGGTDLSENGTATALVAGPDGNVAVGTITQVVDSAFDPTITVTNPEGASGGSDQETDPDFRNRIYGFFPTIRRGTLGAIQFGALQVPGVAVAPAYEILNPQTSLPNAIVDLVVADANGGANSVMIQAVQDGQLDYRAAGIPVYVSGGTVAYQAVAWDLEYEVGVNEAQVQSDIVAVSVATSQFLAAGAKLLRSSLIAAAKTVPGAVINDSSLVTPVGDVVPPNNQTLVRTRPQDVSFT